MVLHVLCWAIEVCYTGLLLENVFTFSHPTAYQSSVRLLGVLDHCQSKREVSIDSEKSTLILQGYTHLDAMSADSEILAQRHARQVSIATDDVALCRIHTTFHSRSCDTSVSAL